MVQPSRDHPAPLGHGEKQTIDDWAEVVAMRRGGVIPHLEHVVTPAIQKSDPTTLSELRGSHPEDGDLVQVSQHVILPA